MRPFFRRRLVRYGDARLEGVMNRIRGRLALVLLVAAPAAGADLPFSSGWELSPKGVRPERVDGRDTLAFETGMAARRDVSLLDGTIEMDVQVTRRRSFVYVTFRMQDDREYEDFYLRPHKSGLPDAVQYAPVYQGQSAWQLYHGPGATAAVEFEPGAWTRLRLVLKGARAAIFLGPGERPVMVAELAREPKAGSIALAAFVPPGTPGAGPVARFANVVVRPNEAPFDFSTAPVENAPPSPGIVRKWALSQTVPATDDPPAALPSAEALGAFRAVDARPSGLVELHRHVTVPKGSRAAACVARVKVRAAQAGIRALDLGFSDRATVFVNGRPLYYGDHSYRFDRPRREGLIGFDQARVYVPLEAGENEVAVLVSDSFGGMGIMGRFADPSGLEVVAR
jgi:hypothetical protein